MAITNIWVIRDILEMGIAFNPSSGDIAAWESSDYDIKPVKWMSDGINVALPLLTDAIEALAADLPHPFRLHIPVTNVAWEFLDEDGEISDPPVCPDFNWTFKPWRFNYALGFYIAFRWYPISDREVANSETWHYIINDVYGSGVELGHKAKWSEIAVTIGMLVAGVLIVVALRHAGWEDIASDLAQRLTTALANRTTQASVKACKDLVNNLTNKLTASFPTNLDVEELLDDLHDNMSTSTKLDEVKALVMQVKSLIGLRLALRG